MPNNTTTIDEKNTARSRATLSRPTPLTLQLLTLAFRIGGTISPKLTGYIAYKLWISPPRFKLPASEIDALASAEINTQKINGQNIATFSWGHCGPTILLIHGWSGRGTQMGSLAKSLVAAGYRVLSFDAPAHGKSSGRQTNIFEISETILGLNKLHGPFESIITHSFGGPCLAHAMQNGLNTTRVVNISPPSTTAGLVKKFALALSIPERAENALMRRIESKFGQDVWQKTSMENNVRDLDLPALVIHDLDDLDVPWHEGETVAHAWSNVSFIKTSKLGHRRILRDPETIKNAVEFIKSGTDFKNCDVAVNASM